MKVSFGFSQKESRGFVLLIPFLLILILLPNVFDWINSSRADTQQIQLSSKIDSLEQVGFFKVSSSRPLFNPEDTAKTSSSDRLESIQRIPFSESDSVTLQIVPGIGPTLAARIVKYRENLGGFHSQEQLLEIYGIKEEVVENLWEYFEFDPGIRRKVKINELDVPELAKHPYIGYGEAKVLVAYRKQHGDFSNSEDLLKIKIFKAEWVNKIEPYLEF
ncbi:ComEA family DNA-binding protein [Algoriphagus hitonicola]|nr:helix-hairpin-helix domain-containing protein [Algoriphagus hitonicola]